MRDRETDSWWSIMSASAIGGPLSGRALVELPVGEKTTWGNWRRRYPETEALSVDGREHVTDNAYAGYFDSDRTFRDAAAIDSRLAAKRPIFGFRLDGVAYAAPFDAIEGGRLFTLEDDRAVFLHREKGSPVLRSSRAYLLPSAGELTERPAPQILERILAGTLPAAPLDGFDTYWYTWSGVNRETRLLR